MKQILLIISFIISSCILSASDSVQQQAINAYQAKDYDKTINLLEAELKTQKEKGQESAALYYNLGNAYFRDNDIAKAMLNYERALLLDPGDRDTRHNIAYAQTKLEDKILEVDTFFLQSWMDGVQNIFTSNTWATVSIFLFLLLIGCLFTFFFSKSITLKKTTFYTGIVVVVFLVFTNIFASNQKEKLTNRNTAIIMVGSAPVVSSPDPNSKELFILHAGTKVKINKEDQSWIEIEIDNGTIGWIQREKLEII